jgi:hypothetical protein
MIDLLRRFARTRLFKTMAVLTAIVLAWQLYLTVQAPGKIDPALREAVDRGEVVRVSVSLNFPPERFHTIFLQDYGRVIRIDGDAVHLRDVRPESVGMLARVYWIDSLAPLEAP